MANWNGLQMTNKGIALQAKVEAGATLTITKLKIGSGVLSSGTDIKTLTDLISPEQNLGIGAKEPNGDYCKISSTISNVGLTAGYYVRELGVFAQDPDEGEILYMYTTDGAPDYLPAEGGSTVISQEFSVNIAVSDAIEIEVTIDPGALATMGYVQLQIQEHNTDENAHANMTGATSDAAGKRGMVPAPDAGAQDKALFGDGTFKDVLTILDTALSNTSSNPVQNKVIKAALDLKAALNSPTFTGTPSAPTATASTNNAQIATTAFVKAVATASNTGGIIAQSLGQNGYVKFANGLILQWGSYIAPVGAEYTDVTTPVSFSRCFLAASMDVLSNTSTTWPGNTQIVWNVNASTSNKLRFLWERASITSDLASWFGIFI
nr:MAG TPA: Baseplate wedge protein [Caudoviricetes sp.]